MVFRRYKAREQVAINVLVQKYFAILRGKDREDAPLFKKNVLWQIMDCVILEEMNNDNGETQEHSQILYTNQFLQKYIDMHLSEMDESKNETSGELPLIEFLENVRNDAQKEKNAKDILTRLDFFIDEIKKAIEKEESQTN